MQAPILFHRLRELGFPVVSIGSRQAYQALKSLATHKTDRNDGRGQAHLARIGRMRSRFPGPRSLPAPPPRGAPCAARTRTTRAERRR